MSSHPLIQRAIAYIEQHLQSPLSLAVLSTHVNVSKFYFHRLFQKEIGVPVGEYVRFRRLAYGATLLLRTSYSILEIALLCSFESQEAFTRAFKKQYQLPPGRYRRVIGQLFLAKEDVMMKNEQLLTGWILSGSHPSYYEVGIDRYVFHQGKASGTLKSIEASSPTQFATMMQQFKANRYQMKRMKLSGFLKTERVEGECGFWMRIDGPNGVVQQFDNMAGRTLSGTTEWTHCHIVLDVLEDSEVIAFGILLSGSGQVWMDSLTFEEVTEEIPLTERQTEELRDAPINLMFEETM
ncbi:AraC family transcriptional regulator [Fictibacillus macauensis ZFHKF-1]|uniref:AraC family transcriptional regulator n=1 Tax=Fictibacillus macauensis ZFHKF-1 TaxID=1196324 RepID=I8UGN8_9BACL|nr:AraC family transcriptional regulator [Fictibacillus macauensis]EIT86055.1 AraC family transcriptional regulator [Fictibacillus macauensis ZFHKF-1]